LNAFAALPARSRTAAREQIISAARDGKIPQSSLHKLAEVKMHLPVFIPGYTDFFCSLEHCSNVSNWPSHVVSRLGLC
jgi:fumarylacetoacetase